MAITKQAEPWKASCSFTRKQRRARRSEPASIKVRRPARFRRSEIHT